MKKAWLAAVLLTAAAPLQAAEPGVATVWPAAELKAYGKKLSPKMNPKKLALEEFPAFGNHFALVAHREADGESELHEKHADMFVVQTGEATLVTGGEIVGGKTTAPGEIRGTSISGGQKRPIAPGDIVHIPVRTPHQVLVAPGKEFTYFVIKVETP
jgi:mannose-6-phosphate isomerase-like protein (cupin superfamily)